ncbi:fungal zn(2)-Cys(6) binuclear cluster domain-containing protein [Trichoderma breve]|uniref:Fungal zn(2)-Cys(6) binuclear cluster domain-containing protein n=1 Tax=Trichoderma breve TaxID=2034170 RepID=A0A9W9E5Y1_9HYPO|nr:fungal zn(2)-Cys(6) binuclear cluster domain-containing protein [Trichoderma breve]KAJ4860283.1 fungal zn(2)-Cys(6) binuclear cluster domain-containing protein [Trichoderma breve]
MTLHRPGDYTEPSSGTAASPYISGRTLIACQNCASAKTGCDKKIPCSRCIDKNLQCTARYARRASKAAIRAAQATSSSTKSQLAGFCFGSQPFQKTSFSFDVGHYPENTAQDSSQRIRGDADQQDDSLWDILNPLSPLSGYSVAAPSLGGSPSYSDNRNAFENKQNSPIPIFSEFSTNLDLLNNDISMRIPKGHRYYPNTLLNDHNSSNPLFEVSYLPKIKDYASLVHSPDAREDTSSFLRSGQKSGLDICSAPNLPHSEEVPNLSCAKNWIKKLRQKGLFDSHFAVGESMQLHQQPKAKSRYSARDRLLYHWVKLDHELSLFHDTEQTISACDLEQPLPDPKLPWDTKNLSQTSDLYLLDGLYADIKTEEALDFEFRPTLNQLFKDFLQGTLSKIVPPRHLQLLLHPLQALVHHSQSLLSWAKHSYSPILSDAANSTLLETQRLLQEWHNLAMESHNENLHTQDTTPALILYHFTCLNLVANFADIERLANRESLSISFWQQSLQNERSIFNRQDAIFHCGQALRYLRAINDDTRPWWWSTAVYRAILTLWAAATLGSSPSHGKLAPFSPKDPWPRDSMDVDPRMNISATPEPSIIAIDNITPEDPVLNDANWSERHMLVLTRQAEGVVVLNDLMGILQYGISLINVSPSSAEGEAVVTKLMDLGQAWDGNKSSQMYYQD